jgi:hypothetical protein
LCKGDRPEGKVRKLPAEMGNKESVPSPAGEEEIAASPQQGNQSKSKQLNSPVRYMDGVPEANKKGSKDRRSSRDRLDRGEAREDDSRASPGQQRPNKRISPTDSPSMTFENNFPLSPGGSRRITDDQVHLDIPMAELMAYLQMVANHSSNLPLTRRDDPDLGRTVSSLTADEYAFKCAAFLPSRIRIIGGQFGKYGRVWDLPTSEVSIKE